MNSWQNQIEKWHRLLSTLVSTVHFEHRLKVSAHSLERVRRRKSTSPDTLFSISFVLLPRLLFRELLSFSPSWRKNGDAKTNQSWQANWTQERGNGPFFSFYRRARSYFAARARMRREDFHPREKGEKECYSPSLLPENKRKEARRFFASFYAIRSLFPSFDTRAFLTSYICLTLSR